MAAVEVVGVYDLMRVSAQCDSRFEGTKQRRREDDIGGIAKSSAPQHFMGPDSIVDFTVHASIPKVHRLGTQRQARKCR
jgi:hypothetical protein